MLPRIYFLTVLFFDLSEETQRKVKKCDWDFLLRVLEKFLLRLDKDGIERCVTFSDCLFLSDHSHNLISVSSLRRNGAQMNFGQSLGIFVNRKATIPFEEQANL